MNAWRGILAVAGFQLRRLLVPQRLALALLGAAFPAAVRISPKRSRSPSASARWCHSNLEG